MPVVAVVLFPRGDAKDRHIQISRDFNRACDPENRSAIVLSDDRPSRLTVARWRIPRETYREVKPELVALYRTAPSVDAVVLGGLAFDPHISMRRAHPDEPKRSLKISVFGSSELEMPLTARASGYAHLAFRARQLEVLRAHFVQYERLERYLIGGPDIPFAIRLGRINGEHLPDGYEMPADQEGVTIGEVSKWRIVIGQNLGQRYEHNDRDTWESRPSKRPSLDI
jgi:hypothetical protein